MKSVRPSNALKQPKGLFAGWPKSCTCLPVYKRSPYLAIVAWTTISAETLHYYASCDANVGFSLLALTRPGRAGGGGKD